VTRAEDIADEFQTSIRTVYRDIAALAEAGVPIVGEAGVGDAVGLPVGVAVGAIVGCVVGTVTLPPPPPLLQARGLVDPEALKRGLIARVPPLHFQGTDQ